MYYNSAIDLIGKTPILRLNKIKERYSLCGDIFAKLEYLNPQGSIKDRVAKNLIDSALADGRLTAGGTIIEATSGNTGIGLAFCANVLGYKAIIVMPDTVSKERTSIIEALGGEVVLTDGSLGMTGAINMSEMIHNNTPNSIIASQFSNMANPETHMLSTAPEIYEDLSGEIDVLVCGVGTGGTITGIGKYLKNKKPDIQIVAVEPEGSPYLSKGKSGVHKIQGIGAGFIPEVLDTSVIDEVVAVTDDEAITIAKELGKLEGILCGISSGAALSAAIDLAKREENTNKNIVVIFPDSADRYYSTELFK